MLKNTLINRKAAYTIAKALGKLNSDVVYVGGAVVSLYIDDPSADDVRPTKDIDISLQITSLVALEELREKLIAKGFHQSHQDQVVCRFRYQDILIDVMSTQAIGWAPANRWFKSGFEQKFEVTIDDVSVYLMPLPYFLASKFDAFYDRGGKDPRTSHDFEDITYLLNHTRQITTVIQKSQKEVQDYLKTSFQQILDSKELHEAIIGNLFYEDQTTRLALILDKLQKTVAAL